MTARPAAPAADAPVPSRVLAVTCARDGRDHLVPADAVTPDCAGHYPALCGTMVRAAGLTCPPGPPCPRCTSLRARQRTARRRGPGLGRVLARLLPISRSPR